ncbi:MAG: ribosome maturation factor RimM [Magnetococcales bacterium]|nr:ribosome maturation factor RimM [Magnetococcales bacterium]
MTESEHKDLLFVGRLLGSHGVKGEIKVNSLTEQKEDLLDFPNWVLGPEGGPYKNYTLVSGRSNSKGLIVLLGGVDNREAAQAMSGTDIWVPRSQLPQLDDDLYYWNDLIGLMVVTQDGEELGKIQHLFETGANDVMSIDFQGEERLVPFTQEVVLKVDVAAKLVVVRLLPGM